MFRSLWRMAQRQLAMINVPKRGFEPSSSGVHIIDRLSDEDLTRLNRLLPWMAFTADSHGRRFGGVAWSGKRAEPQVIPDPRIALMDNEFGLKGKSVLEVGCFEGIHTVGLCQTGANVKAIDSRIENVVKTVVRCAMYGFHPVVFPMDLESHHNHDYEINVDLVHHVGVLYHLKDPVSHILEMGDWVSQGLMLDTHVALDSQADKEYSVGGENYRYMHYVEHGRADVFSGMHDYAKWLTLEDLKKALERAGFSSIRIEEEREERNGKRVLLFAYRK